ncbi:MAG: tRNA threonylcarbamoyladenosine dehydratase [Bacteroidales bacterium]|nr:tRNA threonylcarbamoyladenosine dehydratase [Bacteroidales bacterium]
MQADTDIFSRVRLLLGEEALRRIGSRKVILFGCGGVGSWCADSLVRSGVLDITLVDGDVVGPTNINRQLMATTLTIGQPKVEALRAHLLSINPSARISTREALFSAETAASFPLDDYDYVIDCIDSLKDKITLLELASHSRAALFSSMGAALKIDPTRVRVAEFWEVHGDPLARALRKKMRQEGRKTGKQFLCVYSEELLENRGEAIDPSLDESPIKKAVVNGTLSVVTATFGHTLASLVLRDMIA